MLTAKNKEYITLAITLFVVPYLHNYLRMVPGSRADRFKYEWRVRRPGRGDTFPHAKIGR